ncbi:MAG: CocE/NonD family hydrolase [Thermoplasmatota archaeon]
MKQFFVAILMASIALSGCLDGSGDDEPNNGTGNVNDGAHDVFELLSQPYNTSLGWSQVLEAGPYDILPSQSININVDLSALELGAAIDPLNPPRVHMGIFMPDVPEGTVVPVIADIGPYYEDGDVAADARDSGRLGEFLISNFVPHGYAVAQVSVFGSGQSNHCFDMMGDAEQAGVHAAVEYLGSQAWSNGNVGLIGRSYDGSTPWQAAAMGSEHLATIVPISGLTGIPELMFNNGAAELRTLLFHNVVYGQFAVDGDAEDVQNACPDYLTATATQTASVVVDGFTGPTPYFAERSFFERAKQNYDGSVYLIHGLQDWNVDPHAAMPFYQDMQDTWETKGLFGQWDHAYPDRPGDHSDLTPGFGAEAGTATVRYDWAQDLLLWFNYYLKEEGPKPFLQSEIQDHLGNWRVETDYPNYDNEPMALEFGSATITPLGAGTEFTFSAIAEEDVIISGIPLFKASVTALEPRGQIYVHMENDAGTRIGTGVMDIRLADSVNPSPVVPGVPFDVELRMEAMEAYIPAGEGFTLTVSGEGGDYLTSTGALPLTINGGEFEFHARPVSQGSFFAPVPWAQE